MQSWREKLIEDIEDKRRSAAYWGSFHENLSYFGLTASAICSSIAALSISGKYSTDHPFIFGVIALIPAIWLGVEKGIKPRSLSTYNHSMETKLRIMKFNVESSKDVTEESAIATYCKFLNDEENEFESFMKSFDRSIVSKKLDAVPAGSTVENQKTAQKSNGSAGATAN